MLHENNRMTYLLTQENTIQTRYNHEHKHNIPFPTIHLNTHIAVVFCKVKTRIAHANYHYKPPFERTVVCNIN